MTLSLRNWKLQFDDWKYTFEDGLVSVKHGDFHIVLYVIFSGSTFIYLNKNMEPLQKVCHLITEFVNVMVDSRVIFLAFQNLLVSSKECEVLSLLSLGRENWQEIQVWETKVCYANRSSSSVVSAHPGPGGEMECQASLERGHFDAAGPSGTRTTCRFRPHQTCGGCSSQLHPSTQKKGAVTPVTARHSRPWVWFSTNQDFWILCCHTQGTVINHCSVGVERTRIIEGSG